MLGFAEETTMIRFALLLLLAATPASANDLAKESAKDLAPTGTLRAAYIATNPVQASVDPATGQLRGPAAAIATELARRGGVPVAIIGARASTACWRRQNGSADIGFWPRIRCAPCRSIRRIMRCAEHLIVAEGLPPTGRRRGSCWPRIASARDAGDYFLTRTLKSATLVQKNDGGTAMIVKARSPASSMPMRAAHACTGGAQVGGSGWCRQFLRCQQAVIVPKGSAARLAIVEKLLDEARSSNLIAEAIARAGLVGVDVAPVNSRKP